MSDKGAKGGATNYQVKQLEQQNERLKEALVKLRDLSAHEKQEQQRSQKEIDQLSHTKEKLRSIIEDYEKQLGELKKQVDAALGAEEMVEQLSERNLGLEERVRELQETVDDLERLQDVNEQLQESAKETELELREEVDMSNVKVLEENIMFNCLICYRFDLIKEETYFLSCKHICCKDCWIEYLKEKINGRLFEAIECPMFQCDIVAEDGEVLSLLAEENLQQKYMKTVIDTFINVNKNLQKCPNNSCELVAMSEYTGQHQIVCHCGYKYCFTCGQVWHHPLSCYFLKHWLKKVQDEQTRVNLANVKNCPRCMVSIEKTGGCNKIKCRTPNCKLVFCWLCLQECDGHINEICHMEPQVLPETNPEWNIFLKKYKKNELEIINMKPIEEGSTRDSVLSKAQQVIQDCRKTLLYSYPFCYYLQNYDDFNLLQDLLENLEKATTDLSDCIKKVSGDNNKSLLPKIHDNKKYCEQRHDGFLKCINEGYENGTWKFDLHK